jgi:hypothetical protein
MLLATSVSSHCCHVCLLLFIPAFAQMDPKFLRNQVRGTQLQL